MNFKTQEEYDEYIYKAQPRSKNIYDKLIYKIVTFIVGTKTVIINAEIIDAHIYADNETVIYNCNFITRKKHQRRIPNKSGKTTIRPVENKK